MKVYLGTRSGVWSFDGSTGELKSLGLSEHRLWAILAWTSGSGHDTIVAGSYGAGIFRSTDSGEHWKQVNDGLTAHAIRTLQHDPLRPGAILAGTEPARGFRSHNGGESWQEFEQILQLPGVSEWFLPYSPRAGAIRNYAASASGDLYASVEVGGLLCGADAGDAWNLIQVDPGPRVHDDIHQVIVDPGDGALFVALGGALVDRSHGQWATEPRQIGGVAVSRDDGASWTKLLPDYTRAIHIPSTASEWLIAGPAARTNQGGWIVGSKDRGATWESIDRGIDTPLDDMVERFEETPDGDVWALCSGGRVFAATPGEWAWRNPLPESSGDLRVESVAFPELRVA